ncbi:MAG: hypothetical protein UV53_C0015G0010 [Candidatus Azambacteria bacterium GW2011_GWE1_42_9]|nr:MAG: hypothetical protein UU33_C0001G0394 [Candidatus Azambacteria bacterium GW2011_GWF1_41_10]KKS49428.1 MAG: hypothetical protein UV14_C0001G0174 [Candidatus Azambacteria bacterium GW2011_GWF2_42_22]KKS79094.1 MAG: hypothetical protein UV53_C0015G0010 [Candidatus Azambacteria bacterium GW2011_GWE1_42_9]KKT03539.1 MAG: hypothetical protein UV81_C0001G0135 [Candidatus Azambacteria bacterium GW2011_GWD1_43_18]KKT12567.1 MAG: hypothetical protein UV93_C0003G0129 [Candidatus Azambacteria bacter
MKVRLIVVKPADRVKVVGKILGPNPDFVNWAMESCCYTVCNRR